MYIEMTRLYVIFVVLGVSWVSNGFNLTILHTNDVHARFMQFNKYGQECSNADAAAGNCFGGVARRRTKVQDIRSSHKNVLFMDAGDQFLGTLWFTVFRGKATSHFMNRLGYDVMCLGNHEFDLGVTPLTEFLDRVTFPVVSANTDVYNETRLHNKFNRSRIFEIGGEKVGVVGYITEETKFISNPGSTVNFNDIVNTVRQEVTTLEEQGVNKIIAVGHAGYKVDQQVALIPGVDVVVGGHTDTFLYTGNPPSGEDPKGLYPTVVPQEGGTLGLVVQAFTWAKYLGYLNVEFDSQGVVTHYGGNPILLDASVSEDASLLDELSDWKTNVTSLMTQTIGYSNVFLDGERQHCRLQECNLGNLITDAMIDFHLNTTRADPNTWAPAAIAIINGGGIRASIDKGIVSAGEIIAAQPFGSTVDMIRVTGQNLLDQLETAVSQYNPEEPHGRFLQFSGLKVVYNMFKPACSRVISVDVRCLSCDVPKYSRLKTDAEYNIFINSFLAGGGDGFNFQPIERYRFNTPDNDSLITYIRRHSPVYPSVEGRIQFTMSDSVSGSGTVRALWLHGLVGLVACRKVLL